MTAWQSYVGDSAAKRAGASRALAHWQSGLLGRCLHTWAVNAAAEHDERLAVKRALAHWSSGLS